ncbi:MAG: S9 family peptidase [Candidatus Cloacimonetes bacterium]|nr:S9 family peptidase [Candidatus Cloacimonadota bacterium]
MKRLILIAITITLLIGCTFEHKPFTAEKHQFLKNKPLLPNIEKIEHKSEIHEMILTDNYHWMKDKTRSNKKVLEHIEAENLYTEQYMTHTVGLQSELYEEMISRINETDFSIPYKKGDYFYYEKREKDKQYPIFCRKHGSLEGAEEIILDQNQLAEGKQFFTIDFLVTSDDQNYLAFTVDTSGEETFTLIIKDLRTGDFLPDRIENVVSVCWANDNKTIYYTTDNDFFRTDKLFRHILGETQDTDELIMEEKDGKFYLDVAKTLSGEFIIISSGSKTTSENWFINADDSKGIPQLIKKREQGIEYYLSHRGDDFFILTNEDAVNYKIMRASVNDVQSEWQEYLPHRDSVEVNFFLFKNFMILSELQDAQKRFKVIDFISGSEKYISPSEEIYSLYIENNSEYNTDCFRYGYESFTTPYSIYEYDLQSCKSRLLKQQDVPGYVDSLYVSERIFATADDGIQIPISLVYRKDLIKSGMPNPFLLDGYGSYGDRNDPYFSSVRLSLLDRGIIYGFAHVRGGGEYGKKWYEAGKMLNKKNTFTDFIVCSEFLIEFGYTESEKLIVMGGSAGGLLIGAVLNEAPHLFKAAVADVPFVDVVNTMLDSTLSATISEYEEWGNPNEKEYFDYILSYCPYQNVKRQDYPSLLVMAGFYDTRVNYWEPAKWVAKLREMKTDDNPVLLQINMSGHSGASGRFDFFKELALEYAFIIDQLNLYR